MSDAQRPKAVCAGHDPMSRRLKKLSGHPWMLPLGPIGPSAGCPGFQEPVALMVRVARVVVVDPNQFRVISHSVKKTDPNDARNLALYLAKGLLPEVRMKEKPQAEVASLTQTRDRLVKLRTALKNKVNNLLSARGIELEKEDLSSEKGLCRVLEQPLEGLAQVEREIIVEQIRSLNRSIARRERVIEEAGSKLRGYSNLTSIGGIGSLGASILLSVIGNVKDFPRRGKTGGLLWDCAPCAELE